jgi:hypothetical protein
MPFTQPRSLTDDQVYALTAYLLYMNKVIGEADPNGRDITAQGENAKSR